MIPTLTISIVLYKTNINDLRKCISSLELFTGRIFLYLVDNSPSDALRIECPKNIPHEYIHLLHNPGFGTAHNIAIRKAQVLGSSYHLVLNADVLFETDVLSPILDYMDKHFQVGQIMPRILYPNGSLQHLCKLVPTPFDLLLRRLTFRNMGRQRKRNFELQVIACDKVIFVPYLSGCFMLLRQSALKEIGLFDERFFMYLEDTDLTRRMAERYETIFFPEETIIHKYGGGSYKSLKMLFFHLFSGFQYFNKWGWLNDPIRDKLNQKTLSQLD